MLIDSPRLTPADRAAWARLETYDAALSADPALDRLADQARAAVTEFAAAGPFYISVSWGKDSVVAASLALQVVPGARVVWARSAHFETPECEEVRDAFLAAHPAARYEERLVHLRNPKRGEPGYDTRHEDPDADHQNILKEELTGRYSSGLRAEESRMRRISIGRWSAINVFAWLHRERLPVHPVYAMSMGGYWDRRWLRVHPLCSAPPSTRSAVHGNDHEAWEDHYYPDVIAAAHAARTHLWETR